MGKTTDDVSRYQIHSRQEIVRVLSEIRDGNQSVSVLAKPSDQGATTCILEVNEPQNIVVIDCASIPLANKLILESEILWFETVLDNIRITFSASRVLNCIYKKAPAFSIPFPGHIVRLQRRDYYRVFIPLNNRLQCFVEIPLGKGPSVSTCRIVDVSAGGVSIIDEKEELDATPGRVYKECQVYLPGKTIIAASLEIRNSKNIQIQNGVRKRRIGCTFLNLHQSVVASIQRTIARLERQQNAIMRG